MNEVSVCVVLAVHNRRDKTIACLDSLKSARVEAGIHAHVVLVDDGSTDGTAEAVLARFPDVEVIREKGDLFWCRSMSIGIDRGLRHSPDHLLWLNDDVTLKRTALRTLLDASDWILERYGHSGIVVGSTADPVSGRITYGGYRRSNLRRPFRFELVVPRSTPEPCVAMNGNVVLVSRQAAHRLGNLDPNFSHAMGDTDYALRANAAKVPVVVAPGVVGHCARNGVIGTHLDESAGFLTRWRQYLGRKGLPMRSWMRLTRRHGGAAWIVYFVSPYALFVVQTTRSSLRRMLG